MLRAHGLAKAYRAPSGAAIAVLSGLDLAVGAGEVAVIGGASGSGKSTLLNMVGLLEDPDAGQVWYGDQEVTALGRAGKGRARGRVVGFVFQSFLLLPSLTVLDNVLLAARYVSTQGPDTRRRALALLEEFGLTERAAHHPAQLSGGEQQRAAFCRAVLNRPPLLLADEPTGNLDDANGRVILDALRGRAAEGAAVVIVSHRADAAAIADTVYRLEAGRLTGVDAARAVHRAPSGGRRDGAAAAPPISKEERA